MANKPRAFGTNLANARRPCAPLNIKNIPPESRQHQPKPFITASTASSSIENQENRILLLDENAFPNKEVKHDGKCVKAQNSSQTFDEGIFSQENATKPNDDDKILDDNIEAVKKELNSFLIDSLEKGSSEVSETENKENICDDSCMMVDLKDSSQDDSAIDASEISYIQHQTDFDRFTDYSNQILPYMLEKERKYMADPLYMNNQSDINPKMRCILVDWLVDVADEYNIHDETLFLAVSYIDRFLSKVNISRPEFQLLGTSALFIASKYEEIYPPEIGEFIYITDDSFNKSQILQMEKLILTVLEFDVSTPTVNYFLEKYISDLGMEKEVYCLSKYLCLLSLLECKPFLKYYPSEIALCSILLSSKILGAFEQIPEEFIRKTLDYERSLLSNGDIEQFVNDRNTLIDELNKLFVCANEHPQQAIQRKYCSSKYYKVGHLSIMDANM